MEDGFGFARRFHLSKTQKERKWLSRILSCISNRSAETNVGKKWQTWLQEFEKELHLQRITDDNDKKNV